MSRVVTSVANKSGAQSRPAVAPRVLALIPPMTQLNTPYPSTAYLTGFLRARGVDAVQQDLAVELVHALMSVSGLEALAECARALPSRRRTPTVRAFLESLSQHLAVITPVMRFLQGADPTFAHRIVSRRLLPEGVRFAALERFDGDAEGGDSLAWAFGALGVHDRARHLATLYLNDLADVIREAADARFEFVRYAEALASSAADFAPLAEALSAPETLVDRLLREAVEAAIARHAPQVVLLSVPFPGSVYGAFRIAQTIKRLAPSTVTVLGGGYVNTELRELSEPRVFDHFDYVTLDDGERPLLALLEHLGGRRSRDQLVRTFLREQGAVRLANHPEPDVPFAETGTPTWDGLPRDRYLSLLDLLNPMHRLWSDGRWNKLTVAHGCYWKKCSFCDVSLDYISRYEAASATLLVDRIDTLIAATGESGFHFVDEAAPPKALKAMAQELLQRGTRISWWGNIRFEKTYTPQLCELLAESGCIAVSGGLEVASDRLLALMKKGVTVAQVARVTRAFTDAGIMVHAYLMYGFPTQTIAETVDSLEYVRQLFAEGCLQSGYFHRYTCTVHSPVGRDPEAYGVRLIERPHLGFARNDIGFDDGLGIDHATLGQALARAAYNYMHGIALDRPVHEWFAEVSAARVPRTRVPRDYVARALGAS